MPYQGRDHHRGDGQSLRIRSMHHRALLSGTWQGEMEVSASTRCVLADQTHEIAAHDGSSRWLRQLVEPRPVHRLGKRDELERGREIRAPEASRWAKG